VASETGKRLALAGISVLLALMFVEVAVRIIEPREVLREFFETMDPVLHHKLIPGARGRQKTMEFDAPYEINSLGLREREFPRAKPAGARRILVLGDSFTEGVGVSGAETFSRQLQGLLDTAGLGRWQIINAGVASYSPLLEYLYLKTEGLSLEPDLVLLNLDLSDVYDDFDYAKLAEYDSHGEPVAVRSEPPPEAGSWPMELLVGIKDLAKYQTRTYNFVRRRLYVYTDRARNVDVSGDVRTDKYGMLREELSPDDHDWAQTYANLLKIRDVLRARQIDFWIAVYPYALQVSTKEWIAGRQFWGFKQDQVYSDRPQQWVVDFGQRNDIPVVNMVQDFRDAATTVFPLYYDGDGHWRAAGHRVAAAAWFKALAPLLRARDAEEAAGVDGRTSGGTPPPPPADARSPSTGR
jgi:hypothetical protein